MEKCFYIENQGDWVGSGGIWQVKKGDFTGHPGGLRWTSMPNSPLDLTIAQVHQNIDPRFEKDEDGERVKPGR